MQEKSGTFWNFLELFGTFWNFLENNYICNMKKEFITIPEVARLLRVSTKTVYTKIKSGELTAHKPFNTILIKKEDIDNFIEKSRV